MRRTDEAPCIELPGSCSLNFQQGIFAEKQEQSVLRWRRVPVILDLVPSRYREDTGIGIRAGEDGESDRLSSHGVDSGDGEIGLEVGGVPELARPGDPLIVANVPGWMRVFSIVPTTGRSLIV